MTPEAKDFLSFAATIAFSTCVVIGFTILLLEKKREALRGCSQFWTFLRKTFTSAGDTSQLCADCSKWELPVYCLSCGRTHLMKPVAPLDDFELQAVLHRRLWAERDECEEVH